MEIRHMNQNVLASRWAISPRTLERWHWAGEGPQFIKLGGRVVYRLKDVEAFEAEQIRQATPNVSLSQEMAGNLVMMPRGAAG